ncbi:hypothetical protein ASD52_26275 [Ensifer sp. Root142]|uniref:hypothetical protein n=1 Tax=Ensifer sp. Root142 TaxID=1736461 RepID=UPI00070F35E7|nr:hypothetical protein [Ensifer sp. Root142]KQY73940.1 hypothetical protein ASD52_26275 [Ensifer sp. Root142]
MMKIASTIITVGLLLPGVAWAQTLSSILPVMIGAYAPAEGGCEAAAAAFIYVEDKGLGANKTAGKVLALKQEGNSFVLEVLWIEAGSDETDGDRDTVQIDVKDDRSFYFTNTASKRILMRWCS